MTRFTRLFILCLLPSAICAQTEGPQRVARIVTELQSSFDACKTVDMRVVEFIFRTRMGYPYHCESMPWLRAQRLVNSGEADGMVAIPTAERAAYATASRLPLLKVQMRLYFSKNSPKYEHLWRATTLDELQKDIFVAQRGSGWAIEQIQSRNIAIEWTKSIDLVFNMLARGRGDFTILPEIYAYPIIHVQHLDQQIVMAPTVFSTSEYRFMISKQSHLLPLLKIFDEELETLQKRGEIQLLEEKFKTELKINTNQTTDTLPK